MKTILLLLLLLASPAYADTFRLTAEFLYPNNSVRPVIELPALLLTPGKTSESKYTSDDKSLEIARDHTLKVGLKEAQDQTYDLSFDYQEQSKERGGVIKQMAVRTTYNLSPGKDQVTGIDVRDPAKGVFRIKIVRVSDQ